MKIVGHSVATVTYSTHIADRDVMQLAENVRMEAARKLAPFIDVEIDQLNNTITAHGWLVNPNTD